MTNQITDVVGRTGLLPIGYGDNRLGDMEIEVEIVEYRFAYGRPRFVVVPISGVGSAVVAAEKVRLNELD